MKEEGQFVIPIFEQSILHIVSESTLLGNSDVGNRLITFEVRGIVVKWFRYHLMMTSEKCIQIHILPNGMNSFKLIILKVRIWKDTITKVLLILKANNSQIVDFSTIQNIKSTTCLIK